MKFRGINLERFTDRFTERLKNSGSGNLDYRLHEEETQAWNRKTKSKKFDMFHAPVRNFTYPRKY